MRRLIKFLSVMLLVSLCITMLSPAALAAPSDNGEEKKLAVIPANGTDADQAAREYESRISDSNRNDDDPLEADEIFSEDKVLGVNMGDGKVDDLFDKDKWLGIASANDVIWAVICLIFTGMCAFMFGGTIFSLLKSGCKIILAILRNNNVDESVGVVEDEKRVSVKLIEGLCVIGGLMLFVIFVFNFV